MQAPHGLQVLLRELQQEFAGCGGGRKGARLGCGGGRNGHGAAAARRSPRTLPPLRRNSHRSPSPYSPPRGTAFLIPAAERTPPGAIARRIAARTEAMRTFLRGDGGSRGRTTMFRRPPRRPPRRGPPATPSPPSSAGPHALLLGARQLRERRRVLLRRVREPRLARQKCLAPARWAGARRNVSTRTCSLRWRADPHLATRVASLVTTASSQQPRCCAAGPTVSDAHAQVRPRVVARRLFRRGGHKVWVDSVLALAFL